MTQLTLIGILDDGVAGLSDTARQRLANAQVVIGAGRTLDLVRAHLSANVATHNMDGALGKVPEWTQAAIAQGQSVVILATGDPLCHGLGTWLEGKLRASLEETLNYSSPRRKPGSSSLNFLALHSLRSDSGVRRNDESAMNQRSLQASLEILPNLSTLQLACARFHRAWHDIAIASCHGKDAGEWFAGATPEHGLYPAIRAIAKNPQVFLFTGAENNPARVARALLTAGYASDEITLSVACRLLLPDERLFADLSLDDAAKIDFPEPNVILVQRRAAAKEPAFGLDDLEYIQRTPEKGLITKQEARAVSLAKLRIAPDATVWDIGAGSGSVGLEAARLAPQGHVWAIEKNEADAANARTNAAQFRISNYTLFDGKAPQGLETWPDPDAVFIGGSGGELEELIQLILTRIKPAGRLVMNFVTLENLATATATLNKAGASWDVVQLQAGRSQPILDMHRMAAQNPVWIVTAAKNMNHNDHNEKPKS